MKVEELIKKRFQELELALQELLKKGSGQQVGGTLYPMLEFQQWATSVMSLFERVVGANGAHYKKFAQAQMSEKGQRYVSDGDLNKCAGIFKAAHDDFLGGYMVSFRSLVEAEVLTDSLEQADEFLRLGYKEAACITTGVALETAIRDICKQRGISTTGSLNTMNQELCKAGIYNVSMQKQITAWAGLRNDGAHGNKDAYSKEQVKLMIDGVTQFLATQL